MHIDPVGSKQLYLRHRSHLGLEMASPASWASLPGGISISKFAQGLEGGHGNFWVVPPGPWPGQNTAIYRTGATWASKCPLGPARVLLECPAGPFGPVSGLPGRSKCRSVTHQNSAIYRTGATWPSKWPVLPAGPASLAPGLPACCQRGPASLAPGLPACLSISKFTQGSGGSHTIFF